MKLLHIDLFLPCTFRVIVLFAVSFVTLYTGSYSRLFTNDTFVFEAPFVNILNALYIDSPVFFLKVALGNPN